MDSFPEGKTAEDMTYWIHGIIELKLTPKQKKEGKNKNLKPEKFTGFASRDGYRFVREDPLEEIDSSRVARFY